MKKWAGNSRKIYIIIGFAVLVILAGLLVFNIRMGRQIKDIENSIDEGNVYGQHVAMIKGNSDDVFWTSVYEGAREAGAARDCYVENFGAELSEDYSTEELFEMAIAARVDGIIVEASSSSKLEELINRGTEAGIPVITVIGDAKNSQRKSFVSANDYTLGEMYGREIVDATHGMSQAKVTVVTSSDGTEATPNLIYSGISETVAQLRNDIELTALSIDSSGEFESEESMRNLVLKGVGRPDVIVCLSAIDTVSAYQCVIDYNMVGEIQIVGYYKSKEVLEGIQKGIVKSTVEVNAQEIGQISVEGMCDYITEEYVSEYLPVEAELITKDNVDKYMEKDDK